MTLFVRFGIKTFLILEVFSIFSSATQFQFVALDKPCLDIYRLCSVHCSVSRLKGDFDCQFCVCDDPKYEIAWPGSTTAAPTPPPATPQRHTDKPGQWTVNNITYTRIHNPCYEVEANCPINCQQYTENNDTGNGNCTRCHCPIDAFKYASHDGEDSSFGNKRRVRRMCMPLFCPVTSCPAGQTFKRFMGCPICECVPIANQGLSTTPTKSSTTTIQLATDAFPLETNRRRVRRMCMPLFSCPLIRCPPGQTFQILMGCPVCHCVPIANQVVTTVHPVTSTIANIPTKFGVNDQFIQWFCKPEPDDCPLGSSVVDYRVGDWHCYHCKFPNRTYKALVKPCDPDHHVCPSRCTVRTLTDSRDTSLVCQYCDCHDQTQRAPRKRRFLAPPSPMEVCISNCHKAFCTFERCDQCPVFDVSRQVFGRRRRRQIGGCMACSRCMTYHGDMHFHHTTTPVPSHVPNTQKESQNLHIEIKEDHCLSPRLSLFCPDTCSNFHVSECFYCRCNHKFLAVTFIRNIVGVDGVLIPSEIPLSSKSTSKHTEATTTTTSATRKPPPTVTTTTTTTTTTKPTTTASITQQSSKHVTSAQSSQPKQDSCYVCKGVTCSEKDVQECPSGQDFCMSTISQDYEGERNITRACVTEDDCYNKWWIISADSRTCLTMTNDLGGPSGQAEICNFCCKGTKCNKLGRIPDSKLYKGELHPSSGFITIG